MERNEARGEAVIILKSRNQDKDGITPSSLLVSGVRAPEPSSCLAMLLPAGSCRNTKSSQRIVHSTSIAMIIIARNCRTNYKSCRLKLGHWMCLLRWKKYLLSKPSSLDHD